MGGEGRVEIGVFLFVANLIRRRNYWLRDVALPPDPVLKGAIVQTLMRSNMLPTAALAAALALTACGTSSSPADGNTATTTNGAAPDAAGAAAPAAEAPPATIMAATPELREAGRAVEAVVRSAYAAASAAAVDPNIFVEETRTAMAAATPGQIAGDYRYDGATGPTTPPTFYGVNVTSPTTALVNVDHLLNGAAAHTRWDLCKVGGQWRVRDVNSQHTFTVRQSLHLPLQGGC